MRAAEFMLMVEAMPAKPQKPLTPTQARKRSEKQAKVQQQVRDEDVRHAAKEQDLKARLI
jgi:hypothetical protein